MEYLAWNNDPRINITSPSHGARGRRGPVGLLDGAPGSLSRMRSRNLNKFESVRCPVSTDYFKTGFHRVQEDLEAAFPYHPHGFIKLKSADISDLPEILNPLEFQNAPAAGSCDDWGEERREKETDPCERGVGKAIGREIVTRDIGLEFAGLILTRHGNDVGGGCSTLRTEPTPGSRL
jgi:hypothetical protein